MDHGFEHFRGRNDALAEQTALGNEILLDRRQLRKRNLHAQIAPADHNAGARLTDLFHVVNASLVLNLGDDFHVPAAMLVQKPPHVQHVLLPRDERRRDKINAVLNAEQQIILVLLAQIDLFEYLVRKRHALAVRKLAARHDAAVNFCPLDVLYLKNDQSVVDQHRIAHGKIVCQSCIADGNDRLVAVDLTRREGERIAVLQRDLLIFERADAVFRPLGVEHDGDGQLQLAPHLADHIKFLLVLRMRPVRKVQARDIEPRPAHFRKYLLRAAGRADGTDDLRFSHMKFPL